MPADKAAAQAQPDFRAPRLLLPRVRRGGRRPARAQGRRSSPPRSRSGSSTTSSSPTACRRAASPSATRSSDDSGRDYKAVHYDHGNGLAAADVDGDGLLDLYFVSQLGENQLWKNLGNGKFRNVTGEAGVGLTDQISVTGLLRRRRQRRRPGPLRHHRAQGQPPLPERRQGALQGRLQGGRGSTTSATPRAPSSSTTTATACSTSSSPTSAATPPTRRAAAATTSASSDAFSGHLHPERTEHSILYHNLGNHRFEDVSKEVGLQRRRLERRRHDRRLQRGRLARPLRPQHAGRRPLLRERAGQALRRQDGAVLPQDPLGRHGRSRPSTTTTTAGADLCITDMHSDMSKDDRAWTRRSNKSDMQWTEPMLAGRRQQHLRQRPLPEPGRRQVRGGLGRDGRGELLALGVERRATSTPTAGRTSSSPPA